jgi:glucose-1-phosphate thymidylyltransferase
MLAGIKDILIISTPNDTPQFQSLLENGARFGLDISYAVQKTPGGLAKAFTIGEKFIGADSVSLILGDNVFYGQSFTPMLQKASKQKHGASIFAYKVNNPKQFGIVELNTKGNPISLEEKPDQPKSDLAVTGLYFYDNSVIEIAKNIKPSKRGELEITDVNKEYMSRNELNVVQLGRGFAWLDTGTFDSLLQASQFVETIQKRQGLKIACLEEIAYYMDFISKKELITLAMKTNNDEYKNYLLEASEHPRYKKDFTKNV